MIFDREEENLEVNITDNSVYAVMSVNDFFLNSSVYVTELSV